MTPSQIAKIMALVDEFAGDLAKAHCERLYGTSKSYTHQCLQESSHARAAVEAALSDAPQQAEPSDAKDAARYRYLVIMETKAAPDTVAHYIRNPAHLDRVIEVMEQKP